jgi:hypothetical protein
MLCDPPPSFRTVDSRNILRLPATRSFRNRATFFTLHRFHLRMVGSAQFARG